MTIEEQDQLFNVTIKDIEKFAKKFDILENGCWQFKVVCKQHGYSQYYVPHQKTVRGHRWLYQLVNNVRLGDKELCDHLCRNKACVNPKHIEIVNNRENVLRGISVPALNAAKTHCKFGHEFTPDNLFEFERMGYRHCKTCRPIRAKWWRIKPQILPIVAFMMLGRLAELDIKE